MNYFAHGFRFVENPWFLAGTAVPDWLSVADRRVRMRPERVEPFASGEVSNQSEVAAGVLQHLEDDRRFHARPAFLETSADLAESFRHVLGADNGYRPGFLGHISTELLLDGLLIEEDPERLDEYYRQLGSVDPESVQQAVNSMAKRPVSRLADFIGRFLEAEFLRDYADSRRLLMRLNQVVSRVGLSRLPAEAEEVLQAGRRLVRGRVSELLPPT